MGGVKGGGGCELITPAEEIPHITMQHITIFPCSLGVLAGVSVL